MRPEESKRTICGKCMLCDGPIHDGESYATLISYVEDAEGNIKCVEASEAKICEECWYELIERLDEVKTLSRRWQKEGGDLLLETLQEIKEELLKIKAELALIKKRMTEEMREG